MKKKLIYKIYKNVMEYLERLSKQKRKLSAKQKVKKKQLHKRAKQLRKTIEQMENPPKPPRAQAAINQLGSNPAYRISENPKYKKRHMWWGKENLPEKLTPAQRREMFKVVPDKPPKKK